MDSSTVIILVVFAMIASLTLIIGLILNGRGSRLDQRLDSFKGRGELKPKTLSSFATSTLPKMGNAMVPLDEKERTRLRARMIHAGLYKPQAMQILLGVKLLIMVLATVIGIGLTLSHVLSPQLSLPLASGLFLAAFIGPSFWLDQRKAKRQVLLRRGLPDALDAFVTCLEGGLGLNSALKRVSVEVQSVHRELANELLIVDREIQLGRNAGEALANMGKRTDMEEVVSLSSVIAQCEKFGASLAKSMRTHSETLRQKRMQKAEERAQKASTKVMIPTLFFIFPAVFVVLLAPAVYQVVAIFNKG
jgi:tight adherence protein C